MVDKLPLVVYKNGERIVIGEAELQGDGTVAATITDGGMINLIGKSDMSHYSYRENVNPQQPKPYEGEAVKPNRHNVFDQDKD